MTTIKIIIPALLMIVFLQNTFAKQKIGLYLTSEDFLNHKLSYQSEDNSGSKVLLHSAFESPTVIVVQNGKKHTFLKNEIFGYRLNNQDYRYFNNSAYRIIDSKGFYIYGYNKLIREGKGVKDAEFMYFSSKANSEIKPLTMDNLQSVFSKDARFLYTIQGFFKTDNELAAYDANLKEYKLEYLYAQTMSR